MLGFLCRGRPFQRFLVEIVNIVVGCMDLPLGLIILCIGQNLGMYK